MGLAEHPNPSAPVLSHFSLEGKTAFITGGSRGIGLEVAKGLLEAGASVGITYSSTPEDQVASLVKSLQEAHPTKTIKSYQCNVRDQSSVQAVTEQAAKDLGGRLDIVVANAGIAENVPAEEYPEDKFRNMIDTNFNGAFWTAQAGANIMKRSGKTRGSIIFTASVSAILVNVPQKQAAYNASKAAVVHLAKSLAVEWTDFARVNCISPV
jgi:sorbose reductase